LDLATSRIVSRRNHLASKAIRINKMTFYSVLAVTPTSEEWIPDYIGPANALVTEYGGKYLARTSNH